MANIALQSVSKLAENVGLLEKEKKRHRDELALSRIENNKRLKSQDDRLAVLGDENEILRNENDHLHKAMAETKESIAKSK